MAEQRGFRVLRDAQEEEDFIRDFVRDPGPIATTRSVEQLNKARSDPVAPLGLQGDTVPVEAFRAAERMQSERENAAVTEARAQARSRPGLHLADVEEGVPSFRRFEYTPGPGRGLRGQIETATARPGFVERFNESLRAGAYDPVTPQRRLSAQRVQEGRGRALQAMRGLGAARMGVPERFLDAVRQGQLTGREANILAAQQPVASGRGLSAADVLRFQQGEQQAETARRRADTARMAEFRQGRESDNRATRNATRDVAFTQALDDPNDQIATNEAANYVAEEIMDKGDPGLLDMILPFGSLLPGFLRGSPQAIWDPDIEAAGTTVLDGLTKQGPMIVRNYRGVPTLFAGEDPVVAWKDLSTDSQEFLRRRRRVRSGLKPE